jgi:hypothetical protein
MKSISISHVPEYDRLVNLGELPCIHGKKLKERCDDCQFLAQRLFEEALK